MLRAQKMAKLSHRVHGWAAPTMPSEKLAASVHPASRPLPRRAPTTANIAPPPIQVWIPNQPQATTGPDEGRQVGAVRRRTTPAR